MAQMAHIVFRTSLLLLVLLLAACGGGGGSPGVDARGDGASLWDTPSLGDGSACTDECPAAGARDCVDGGYATCGRYDADACLEWSAVTPCDKGACEGGFCQVACEDDCDLAGDRRCADNVVQVCRNGDADVCLEWDDEESCAGACTNGYCAVECDDECDSAGALRCAGNAVQSCANHDADPCLEWGGDNDCGADTCSNGFCEAGCTSECTTAGARTCEGSTARTCGNHDADACLEWGADQDCGVAGCAGGYCQSDCSEDCTTNGQRRCSGNVVQTCANHDSDPCLEWGGDDDCGALVCSNGFCALTCDDECTADGARRCSGGGFQICSNYDEDDCLEWGPTTTCPAGETCSNGRCRSDCVDECTVVNARRCDGSGGYQLCGTYDADSCLEWGTTVGCAQGQICTNGFCATGCTSECTVAGATRCDGAAVATCGDANLDGCLTWGTAVPCGEGETCSNGRCATGCTSECTVAGAVQCDGNAVQTCGDLDGDGCLGWGTGVPCGLDEVCSNGHCAVGCTPECTTAGARRCGGDAYEICGDADGNGCLEWGTAVPCGADESCSDGYCSSDCVNECTVSGARRCDGNGVQECGDTDSDPCLEWGTTAACAASQTCSNGWCAIDCDNECTLEGARQCTGTVAYQLCSEHDGDGCLEWGTPVACDPGLSCSGGSCTSGCVSECTYVGALRCDDAGSGTQTCGDPAGDGCLRWGTAVACPPDTTCSNGVCQLTCVNECTTSGGRRCEGPTTWALCDDHDADPCLEWGSAVACPGGEVCSDGLCAVDCVDECQPAESRQCNAAATAWQQCADSDDDGCLEWGSEIACADDQVCASGYCAIECSSTCDVSGATACNLSETGVLTCGDHNDDGCLEWGTAAPCGATETCVDGACEPVAVPGELLISEVLYDGTATGDTDAFVELYGDPGLDLTGFVVVGVNGSNNQDYQTIALSGSLPDDGFLVIAHPSAPAALLAVADVTNAGVDYQNGPDSIQLRYGATVVDAVGYGDFAGASFAGEGSPAIDVAAGHSLARDANLRDTDNNAADFADQATPTPGTWNGPANERPVARVTCPDTGRVGQALTFDGSASTDADGTIAGYAFDFGDQTVVTGPSPVTGHTYTAANNYTVRLTVTDNRGATGSATCDVAVTDPNVPTVVFVRPMENLQVTQGTVVVVEIGATAGAGRSVSRVELLADGVVQGTPDTSVPYQFTYTVPTAAVTGSTITLGARATDNQGGVGYAAARLLFVRNDPPVASFSAIISGLRQVSVSAAGCTDTETPTAQLEVRWDWENDGAWDTGWSTTKDATHTYATGGEFTIGMQVRDAVAQVTSTSRTINFQMVQDVFGTVNSTMWMGTVNITGDAVVPAGQTLRIASGTNVVFVQVDENPADGTGDYDLTINGTLSVEGTAENPVIFTVLGTHAPRGWNRIAIGSGATDVVVRHAVFEYADVALDIRAGGTVVEDCEFRFNRIGVYVGSTSTPVTMNRVDIHDSTSDGLQLSGGEVTTTGLEVHDNGGVGVSITSADTSTFTDCVVTANGSHGFRVDRARADLTRCAVTYNAKTGLYYLGTGAGTLRNNQIKYNDEEGLRAVLLGGSGTPIDAQYNNVFGNGETASLVIESAALVASTTGSYNGTMDSATFATPAGERLIAIEEGYSEYDYSSSQSGYVRGNGGALISHSSDSALAWTNIEANSITSVLARVSDGSSSYYGTQTIGRVAYARSGRVRQVTVLSTGAVVNARHNYFGVWPDVLAQVTYSAPAHLDLQGFVGVAFDETWSVGPYRGGDTLNADTAWTSDVFVTGNIDVASGRTLTVSPGVTVTFVPTDEDGNNQGDWAIDRGAGTLRVDGSSSQPVLFTTLGTVPSGGGYRYVGSAGSLAGTTTVTWGIFEKGRVGLQVGGGTGTVTDTVLRNNKDDGLHVSGGASLTGTRLTAEDNLGDGVQVNATAVLSYLTTRRNAGWGAQWVNTRNATNAITDSTISNNTAGGVFLDASQVLVDHDNISYNGYGVRLRGQSSGNVTYNNIIYNTNDGVFVAFAGAQQPTNLVNSNNIYGNGTQLGGYATTISASVSTTSSYNGTSDGTPWSAGSDVIEFVKAGYSEYDYNSSQSGYVVTSTGTTLLSFSSDVTLAWNDIASSNATSVKGRVSDGSSSYYGSTTVSAVFLHKTTVTPARIVEMSAVLRTAGFDAKGNYWGIFGAEVSGRIVQADTSIVDFSGFRSSAVDPCGPR